MQTYKLPAFVIALSIFVATAALYLPSVKHDFVLFDDNAHLYENPYLSEPLLPSLMHLWSRPYFSMYVPVTYSVWRIETALFGAPRDPALNRRFPVRIYHATNIFLHALNAALVFSLLGSLGIGVRGALFGSALFALHPLQTEVVAWISCLKDALAMFFSLLALRYYVEIWRTDDRRRRNDVYVYATVAYLLALLSKPSALILPAVAVVLARGCLGVPWRRNFVAVSLWLVIAIPTVAFLRTLQPSRPGDFIAPWVLRPYLAADALGFYVSKFLFPVSLSLDYGRHPEKVLSETQNFLPLIPFLLTALIWFLPKTSRRPYAVVLSVWAVALLPVLGVFPFRFQQFSTVGDRYVYFAMLAPALALGWFVERFRTRPVTFVVVAILMGWSTISFRQQRIWKDSETLFGYVLSNNPRSLIAHANLGATLSREGNAKAAIRHYETAISIKPQWIDGHYNLGVLWLKQEQNEKARERLQTLLDLAPDYPGAAELLEKIPPPKS